MNAAVLRAAAGEPRVSVVRIDTLLSRTGAHEPFRVIRGRRVKMYLRDALHLSPAGTSLAASAVVAALRDAGALPRKRADANTAVPFPGPIDNLPPVLGGSRRFLLPFLIAASALFAAAPAQAQIPGLPPLLPWLFPPLFPPTTPPADAGPPGTPAPPGTPDTDVKPIFLGADISNPGSVTLGALGPPGGVAAYYERIGSRRVHLGDRVLGTFDQSLLQKAQPWRCDRLVRHFEANVRGPDNTALHAARSRCVRRPAATASSSPRPRRVARGRNVTVAHPRHAGAPATPSRGSAWHRPGGAARCRTVTAAPRPEPRQLPLQGRRARASGRSGCAWRPPSRRSRWRWATGA